MAKRMGDRSVLLSWVVSYLLVLALPILTFTVSSAALTRSIQKEVLQANQVLVSQMQRSVDEQLQEALRFLSYLRADKALQNLLPVRLPLTNATRYDIFQISADFYAKILQNTGIETGYIYLPSTDQVLVNGSVYDLPLLMKAVHADDALDLASWTDTLNAYHYSTLRPVLRADGSTRVLLLGSLPLLPLYQPHATIVLALSQSSIQQRILEMPVSSQSAFLLLAQGDQIVASNRPVELPEALRFDRLSQAGGSFTCTVEGQAMMAVYTTSTPTGWKLLSLTPLSELGTRLRILRAGLLVSLSVSGVLGLAMSYWMAKRRLSFIDHMLRRLQKSRVTSETFTGNEYNQINRALDEILRHTGQLDQLAEKQQQLLQRSALERLLRRGVAKNEDPETLLAHFDLSFRHPNFVAILLFLNENIDTSMAPSERDGLLLDCAASLREICMQESDCHTLMIEATAAVLCNLPEDFSEPFYERLYEVIRARQQQAFDRRHAYLLASFSRPHAGIHGIHEAYRETMEWMGYALLVPPQGMGQIFTSQQHEGRNAHGLFFSPMQEELLALNVTAGNAEAARRLVERIINQNIACVPMDLNVARCLMYDIAATLIKCASDDASRALVAAGLNAMSASAHVYALQQTLLQTVSEVCGHIQKQRANTEKSLLDTLLATLKEHFADPEFNITRLAQMLDMNLSYLSKYFKDNTGVGLYDYLNRMRIAKAKELIASSEAPIAELIRQAGFENPGSFIRVFKKYEGMTPGVYKKSQKQEN